MNTTGMRTTLALGFAALALATAPASAERYIVEPLVAPLEAGADEGFSQAELDQLLAPVALYPDNLLSQVLVATTYPLEIVEAARWSRQNPHLQGEDAVAAVADRDWDPSIQALVAFPDLLARLDEDLEWTRQVGDAMLFQEAQVMDSIQFLRARADGAGNLKDTEQVRIIREERTIVIEPAQPRVVYLPYYDPWVIYGTWWRPAYPPVVWVRPAHYYYGYPGVYWSPGIRISTGFFYTGFYWPQRSVVIVNKPRYYAPPRHRPARYSYVPGQRWQHNPVHRRGVQYRHLEVRDRYAHRSPERSTAPSRATSSRGATPTRGAPSADRDARGRPSANRDGGRSATRGDGPRGDGRGDTRWQGSRDSQERQAVSTRVPRTGAAPRSEDVTRNLRSTRPTESRPPGGRGADGREAATRPTATTRSAPTTQSFAAPRATERTTTSVPRAAPTARTPNRVTTSRVPTSRPATGVRETVRQATRPQVTQQSQPAPRPQATQRSQAAPQAESAPRSRPAPRAEAAGRPTRDSRPSHNTSRSGSAGRGTAPDRTNRR